MDVEPEKLAQSAARALADYTGCAAVATTPQAEDLCIAHFEVVQVGRYSAAVLAVTSSGGVRTRVARIHTGLTREDADEMARLLNSSLTFVAPEDLTPSLTASLVLSAGRRLAPVVFAAEALVRTRPQFYLEGVQYLAKMPDVRTNLGALLEVFLTTKRPAPDRTGQRQSDRHVGRGYRARHAEPLHRQQALPCGRRAVRHGGGDRLQPHGVRTLDPRFELFCN